MQNVRHAITCSRVSCAERVVAAESALSAPAPRCTYRIRRSLDRAAACLPVGEHPAMRRHKERRTPGNNQLNSHDVLHLGKLTDVR
jgi:hypothetical protein